ncbi:ABC1 family-domain-containing protein [Cokeromyces recurvatus]|uniref:ABC1 family-domain-containing protein n=1 Tax=Cokeromyces recurvatus TaxID=90255 RepID=UPI00221EE911|nr:ABC1 family-domain-containing protein [Cokeromyces recurvatus]KAI7906313.1 ABC1 family-domain-containing protein [Cokeromyces recurvatus]
MCQRLLTFLDDWILEPLLTLRRLAHIIILFTPVIATTPIIFLGAKANGTEERSGTLWWYDFLAKQMERAGPTFIKLAQWIASRTDLFPLSLCYRLSKLHSHVDPHSFKYTQKVIEEAFGRQLDQVFLKLEPKPLGVGAIAQVYKATLRSNILPDYESREVAIKVLHPKARHIVQRDLTIMEYGAKLITLIPTMQWLSLPDEVRVFGEMMMEQLDLRGEAHNLCRFNDYFQNDRNVKVPKPYRQFSTRDMLIEEYERSIPLDLFLKQASYARQHELEPVFAKKLADIGLNAFLHMLIFFNFVHADLHPGNIMVEFYKPSVYHPLRSSWSKWMGHELKDEGETAVNRILRVQHDPVAIQQELEQLEQEGYAPRLVFIDTGLVNELNEVNRRNFLDLFQAIAHFDGYRAGELMVERCRSPEVVIQPDVFALRMQNLILGLKQSTFHLGTVKIGNLLHETMNMVRSHHVKMEGDFINVVVSIMLLEGIGRQLNPDLDLLKNALPVLRDYSLKEGRKVAMEDPKAPWLKVWIFLELRAYLGRNSRDEEWLKLW